MKILGRRKAVFAFAGLFLLGALPLMALTPLEMHDLHLRAERGGLAEANIAVSKLEAELQLRPKDQLARAYLGSSNTLKSRSESVGPGKLKALLRGGELMDEAVAAVPNDPRVRLIRATNFLKLPAIFGKRSEAYADFDLLLTSARDAKNDLLPDERAAIFYFAGQSLDLRRRQPEARAAWKSGLAVVQSKPLETLLQNQLLP